MSCPGCNAKLWQRLEGLDWYACGCKITDLDEIVEPCPNASNTVIRLRRKLANSDYRIEKLQEQIDKLKASSRIVPQAIVDLQPIYTYDEFGEQRFACACCQQTAPHGGLSEMEHEERCPLRMARELLRDH